MDVSVNNRKSAGGGCTGHVSLESYMALCIRSVGARYAAVPPTAARPGAPLNSVATFHSPHWPASRFSDSDGDRLTPRTRHLRANAAVSSPTRLVRASLNSVGVPRRPPRRPRFAECAARAALCKVLRAVQRWALRSTACAPPARRPLAICPPSVSLATTGARVPEVARLPPPPSSETEPLAVLGRSVVERIASTTVGTAIRLLPPYLSLSRHAATETARVNRLARVAAPRIFCRLLFRFGSFCGNFAFATVTTIELSTTVKNSVRYHRGLEWRDEIARGRRHLRLAAPHVHRGRCSQQLASAAPPRAASSRPRRLRPRMSRPTKLKWNVKGKQSRRSNGFPPAS